MCVIPVFNYTCKHVMRQSLLLCQMAETSGIACRNSPEKIFEQPFRCNPCFSGEEPLQLASGKHTASDAVTGVVAKSDEPRGPTAVDRTETPTMTGNPYISSTSYDEEGRVLVPTSSYDGRLGSARTNTAPAESHDSNQDLCREDNARLQFNGSSDDSDNNCHRKDNDTSDPAAASPEATSPAANTSEDRQDTDPSISTQFAAVPSEPLPRTTRTQPAQNLADCLPGTEEEAARRYEGAENLIYFSRHVFVQAVDEPPSEDEASIAAARRLSLLQAYEESAVASAIRDEAAVETLTAHAHVAVPTPEQDEEVPQADVLTTSADQDRGEAATAMGTGIARGTAAVVAPIRAAALLRWVERLLSQAQQILENVETAWVPGNDETEHAAAPVMIGEDVEGDTEEDTEVDSEETQAYLQRLIWRNTVMDRWPRSEY